MILKSVGRPKIVGAAGSLVRVTRWYRPRELARPRICRAPSATEEVTQSYRAKAASRLTSKSQNVLNISAANLANISTLNFNNSPTSSMPLINAAARQLILRVKGNRPRHRCGRRARNGPAKNVRIEVIAWCSPMFWGRRPACRAIQNNSKPAPLEPKGAAPPRGRRATYLAPVWPSLRRRSCSLRRSAAGVFGLKATRYQSGWLRSRERADSVAGSALGWRATFSRIAA